jgi:hypothetical protein
MFKYYVEEIHTSKEKNSSTYSHLIDYISCPIHSVLRHKNSLFYLQFESEIRIYIL